jgi:hypothetical protein
MTFCRTMRKENMKIKNGTDATNVVSVLQWNCPMNIECSRVPKIVPTYSNRDPWFSWCFLLMRCFDRLDLHAKLIQHLLHLYRFLFSCFPFAWSCKMSCLVNVEVQNSHLKEFGLTLVFPWHDSLCLNNGNLKQNSAEQVHLKGFILLCELMCPS